MVSNLNKVPTGGTASQPGSPEETPEAKASAALSKTEKEWKLRVHEREAQLTLIGEPAIERAFADLCVFDPATVADRATFLEPEQPADGIVLVLVNGVPVRRDGADTGRTPGRVVGKRH